MHATQEDAGPTCGSPSKRARLSSDTPGPCAKHVGVVPPTPGLALEQSISRAQKVQLDSLRRQLQVSYQGQLSAAILSHWL